MELLLSSILRAPKPKALFLPDFHTAQHTHTLEMELMAILLRTASLISEACRNAEKLPAALRRSRGRRGDLPLPFRAARWFV